jgi:predicted Holliday junction resolvase-like endonuclease
MKKCKIQSAKGKILTQNLKLIEGSRKNKLETRCKKQMLKQKFEARNLKHETNSNDKNSKQKSLEKVNTG